MTVVLRNKRPQDAQPHNYCVFKRVWEYSPNKQRAALAKARACPQ